MSETSRGKFGAFKKLAQELIEVGHFHPMDHPVDRFQLEKRKNKLFEKTSSLQKKCFDGN